MIQREDKKEKERERERREETARPVPGGDEKRKYSRSVRSASGQQNQPTITFCDSDVNNNSNNNSNNKS